MVRIIWRCVWRQRRIFVCRNKYVVPVAALMGMVLYLNITVLTDTTNISAVDQFHIDTKDIKVDFKRVKRFLEFHHRTLVKELDGQHEHIMQSTDPSIYKERRERVGQVCDSRHGSSTSFSMTDFLSKSWFVEKHKLIYCEVPKTGCTFWKRTLEILRRNDPRQKTPYELLYEECRRGKEKAVWSILNEVANGFSEDEIVSRRYTKFMFTREPFERLFSAYVDKFFSPNKLFWTLGRYAIYPRRANQSFKGKFPGHDVSFAEFIHFILTTEDKYLDNHLKPATDVCDMCNVQFDIIGKLETFKTDVLHILSLINATGKITIQNLNIESTIDSVIDLIGKVFQYRENIEIFLDFEDILRRVWRRLKISNVLDSKEPFPFSKEEIPSIQMEHFAGVVIDLYKRSINIRRNNKKVAFLQAYRQLSDKMLNDLREKFRLDFEMFGYDIAGPHLDQIEQSLTSSELEYDYFDIIH